MKRKHPKELKLTPKEFYNLFEFKYITESLVNEKINRLIDFIKEMDKMMKET